MSFNPTVKQLDAIQKMEIFCKFESHKTSFINKQEFDDYFLYLKNI
jgi:hypothetical protein